MDVYIYLLYLLGGPTVAGVVAGKNKEPTSYVIVIQYYYWVLCLNETKLPQSCCYLQQVQVWFVPPQKNIGQPTFLTTKPRSHSLMQKEMHISLNLLTAKRKGKVRTGKLDIMNV